ncbi:MAG TPA: glycine-rich protein, partial [Solirubrobacteraceae bacterium]|nr:glycine-rich protein [Solirubrobacteraceae bacterium]
MKALARRGLRRCTAAMVGSFCVALLALATAAEASETTEAFHYTGGEQTFIVPSWVSRLQVLAIGGRGGDSSRPGGSGAEVTGEVDVTPGELLYVEVGGEGGTSGSYTSGGWNGGGEGAGGGGGASDIRLWPQSAGLSPDTRLIVAG